jgi:hypothetical protein
LTRILDATVEPIERSELGQNDESHWTEGKDPWMSVTAMPFFDSETRQSFILIAAYGGRAEMSALIDAFADHAAQYPEAADQLPLVQLNVREYVKDNGAVGYAMQLDVVGWVDRPAAVLHIQPPPLSITPLDNAVGASKSSIDDKAAKPKRKIAIPGKPELDDEIPFN